MLYRYVGPPHLRGAASTARGRIASAADVVAWARRNGEARGEFVVTFIVNAREELWIADRHSEHVWCAAGGPVKSAGEMTFVVDKERVEVVAMSNQSTGYCPPPSTWLLTSHVLGVAGLPHPETWTEQFDFRRCDGCGAINLIKDDWFVCAVCDADLAREWNFGG